MDSTSTVYLTRGPEYIYRKSNGDMMRFGLQRLFAVVSKPVLGIRSNKKDNMVMAPDGKHIYLAAEGGVKTFNIATTKVEELIEVLGAYHVHISGDGKTLAFISGKQVYVWDLLEKQLQHFAYDEEPHCISLNEDGTSLAVGLKATAQIWIRDLRGDVGRNA